MIGLGNNFGVVIKLFWDLVFFFGKEVILILGLFIYDIVVYENYYV